MTEKNESEYRKRLAALLSAAALLALSSAASVLQPGAQAAYAATCEDLPVAGTSASGYRTGYPPKNVRDNDLDTRWAEKGVGSWIKADLGSLKSLCSIDIAWYRGDERTNSFKIELSADGSSYYTAYSGKSSGRTLAAEKYALEEGKAAARYVRVTVNGNTQNSWAAITELDIKGATATSLPSPPPSPPSPPDKLIIRVMTVSSDTGTQRVIKEHLDGGDFINNFRLQTLAKFPEQIHMLNTESHKAIRDAINAEIPRSGVRVDYIAYDNEAANGDLSTPPEELVDPAKSTNEAMDIIHKAGYKSAIAPTRALLSKEYKGVDFAKVDYMNMQLQKVVGEPDFNEIAEKVSAEARAENPDIIITAQVNPSLNSIKEIMDAVDSVRDDVDGISIMWNGDDASVLDELLTALGR